MLTAYIRAAMHKATYKRLANGTYFGEIPMVPDVEADDRDLSTCRDRLQDALEAWLVNALATNAPIPVIDGIELKITRPTEPAEA